MPRLSVANYPQAALEYTTGLDGSGNVRHTASGLWAATDQRDPTYYDDVTHGNPVGRIWLNRKFPQLWECMTSTALGAVWRPIYQSRSLPLDAVTGIWTAAYGTKALSKTWLSGNLFRVVRASDSTTLVVTAINGLPDIASLAAFLEGTTGKIDIWYDQSGNANNATQTTAANRPWVRIVGSEVFVAFDGASGGTPAAKWFDLPAIGTNLRATSLVSVLSPPNTLMDAGTGGSNSASIINLGTTDNPSIMWGHNGDASFAQFGRQFVIDGNFVATNAAYQLEAVKAVHGITLSASAAVHWLNETTTSGTALATGTPSGGRIGYAQYFSGAFPLMSDMQCMMIAGATTLSAAQRTALFRALYATFDVAPQYVADTIVLDGDSITEGYQAYLQGASFFSVSRALAPLLSRPCRIMNYGKAGNQLSDLNTSFSTRQNLGFSSASFRNIYIVAGGTNDIDPGVGNQSAATAITRLTTLVATVRANAPAGVKIGVCTISPFGSDSTAESRRITYNSSIRSNYSGSIGADFMVDIGGDATIGAPSVQSNTDYFFDLTHLTGLGQGIRAHYLAQAINLQLA